MPNVFASVCALLIGTPSITYSGSLDALSDVPPRMRICAPAPGSPLFVITSTPAARPWSIWFTFVVTPTFAAAGSMVATEPVIASRRCVP
ncbi:MAG: hypothetical protein AUJ00_03735 [Gemmatimonadetes bacterium 13_1_40CM_3_70_6]|nr:MAG: hypothetical protein AUJ00_03735 [Gemmatimonadetes bacterium 13_1_40CM_3_70_6]